MKRGLVLLVLVLAAGLVWLNRDLLRSRFVLPLIQRSPHEQYTAALERAGLHMTALGRDWLAAATRALEEPQSITLPTEVSHEFTATAPAAVAFRFDGRRGQKIEVDLLRDERGGELFVDLFERDDERWARVASAEHGASGFSHEVRGDGAFVLRVQPELLRGGRVTIRPRASASLLFPVQGRSSGAIGSGFGAPREGGRRHEGLDIFAARGTPVVAAADGFVTSTADNRLGGRVVWLWDPERGHALYYAHLDRSIVTPGEPVTAGEVVGYVGNTGNARTTPPHLHFGIYEPLAGAVDPLPFVCDAPCGARGMTYAR